MQTKVKDIKPFIGSKNYNESRKFYKELGFEVLDGEKYCEVRINDNLGFWLQNYYHKGWVNNSMVYLEVDDIEGLQRELIAKDLHNKYKYVRFTEIKRFDWGREIFMHDPSGVLWHFCELNKETDNTVPSKELRFYPENKNIGTKLIEKIKKACS